MNKLTSFAPVVARVLLGLVFFVFGLNGFLQFLPMPPMEGGAADFMGALAAAGYMFPLIKGTEVVAGLMLLSGRFVPLALTLLAPITVNILLFHAVLQGVSTIGMSLFLIALQVGLAYAYREHFAGILRSDAKPAIVPPATTAATSAA